MIPRRARPLACAALLLIPAIARAEWPRNGRIASTYGDQELLSSCPNGSGGALVAWTTSGLVIVQNIEADGEYAHGWPTSGVAVPPLWFSSGHYEVGMLGMTSDHAGGAYFALFAGDSCVAECGGDPGRIYAQRVAGPDRLAPGWSETGVLAFDMRIAPPGNPVRMVSSAGHGVQLAALTDSYYDTGRILVQSVSDAGSRLWGSGGIELAAPRPATSLPALVGDARGGMFVFWGGATAAGDPVRVHAQHVSADGRLQWGAHGIELSPALTSNDFVEAVSDGSEGAIVTWSDGGQLFASRVTRGGGQPWHSVPVTPRSSARPGSRIASDGDGGLLAAWVGSPNAGDGTVFAQHISHGGNALWPDSGVPVCPLPGMHDVPSIVADGADGAYVAWADSRDAIDMAVQHVTSGGAVDPTWPRGGFPVSGRLIHQDALGIERSYVEQTGFVPEPDHSPILVWQAWRLVAPPQPFSDFDYAMRIGPDGPAAPAILPIEPGRESEERITPSAAVPGGLAIESVPAPARRDSRVRFSLASAEPVRIELLDVTGRRVATRNIALAAGEHEVALFDRASAPAGVYFLRLTQGAASVSRRIVVIR